MPTFAPHHRCHRAICAPEQQSPLCSRRKQSSDTAYSPRTPISMQGRAQRSHLITSTRFRWNLPATLIPALDQVGIGQNAGKPVKILIVIRLYPWEGTAKPSILGRRRLKNSPRCTSYPSPAGSSRRIPRVPFAPRSRSKPLCLNPLGAISHLPCTALSKD